MKKLILLLIVIPVLSYAQEYYAGDTLITKTVSATQWDTVSFGRGLKSIDIHNQTGGVLSFAFRRNGDGKRDTVNAKTIADGNRVIIPDRKDTVIFLQSTVSGTAKITVYYGSGDAPIIYYPINSGGVPVMTISQAIIDSLQSVIAQPFTGFYWFYDTLSTSAIDTLILASLGEAFRQTWIWADSALLVSDTSGFISGRTMYMPAGSWNQVSYSTNIVDTLFIKKYSGLAGEVKWSTDTHYR
jgi:hypothetical protein